MRQWIGSELVQIMACRLFGAKPLSKPSCFIVNGTLKNKFQWIFSQNTNFHSRKCIWSYRVRNGGSGILFRGRWVNTCVSEPGHYWCGYWLVAYSKTSHRLSVNVDSFLTGKLETINSNPTTKNVLSRKCICKYRLQYVVHFIHASMCQFLYCEMLQVAGISTRFSKLQYLL